MNKTLLSTAVVAAMGLGAMPAQAVSLDVTGFTIKDVGSNTMAGGGYSTTLDGISGAFGFSSMLCNANSYFNCQNFWTGDVGTGTIFAQNTTNPTSSFSTGFDFGGPDFIPFTSNQNGGADNNFAATIETTTNGLTVTDLGFGGQFSGAFDFTLFPDSNFPLDILWVETGANAGEYNVAMRWGHIITTAEDGTGKFTGQSAQWVLEGCMTTNAGGLCAAAPEVPVPAAAWLFGSGLVGLAGIGRRRKTRKS